MLAKLKSKFKSLPAIGSVAVLALTLAGGFLLSAAVSSASTYSFSDLNLTTDIVINGQPGNLIRIVRSSSQSVSFTVNLTVKLSASTVGQLNLGGQNPDKLSTDSGQTGDRPLMGIGEVLLTSDQVGCQSNALYKFFGANLSFLECDLIAATNKGLSKGTSANRSEQMQTFQLGTPFSWNVQLDSSALQALKITDPGNNTASTSRFQVAPWIKFETYNPLPGSNPIHNFVVTNAGKEIFVQYVNSLSDPLPTDVPAYGPASSNAGLGSQGGSLLGLINGIIGGILGLVQEFIFFAFANLIAPMIQAILQIHPYTDTFVGVIYPAWIVVRNASNIMFIIAIIAIAMGTLFRVESYQYRHLLVQLIIAALLVNFSLVIGQAVLGLADTAQNQFLPNNTAIIRSLGKNIMVDPRGVTWNFSSSNGYFSDTVKQLFFLALALGGFFAFCAVAAFLVIRIVMLWILLMVSPVAYVAGILPQTNKWRGEWWSTFIKYAFLTPIIAFLLNVAAYVANLQQNNGVLNQLKVSSAALGGNNDFGSFVFTVASDVIVLVFLFAALMAAEKLGTYGGKFVSDWGKKVTLAPLKGAGFLGETAGRWAKKRYDKASLNLARGGWASRQLFKALHPVAFVKAIREEGKEERELYKTGIESGATQVARQQFGWRRKTESPMYLFDEHKGKELYEKEEGEWSDNEQQVMGTLNRLAEAAKRGDLRAQVKLKHALREAFKHKNLNEALEGENGLAKNFLGGKLNYNSNNLRYFFQRMQEKGFIDKNFTAEFLKKLGKDGYEIGDYNGVELAYSDPETGHPHLIKMDAPVNGNALPVGWSHYLTERNRLIDEADTEGRALGITDPDKLAVEIDKILIKKENDFAKTDDKYANSMHAERSRRYMKINMSKKNGATQVSMFHDSVLNNNVVTGDVEVSDGGTEILGHMDAGKMYAMGRDNMPAKTKDKFMKYMTKVMDNPGTGPGSGVAKIESQLKGVITAKYREAGQKVSSADIDREVAEQRNFWLAAGYSILSSKPGTAVMGDYFEKISEEEAARAAGVPLAAYQAGGVTLTPAQQATATANASVATQKRLVESIMNFKK